MKGATKQINYVMYCKIPKSKLPGVNTPAFPSQIENAIGDLFHNQFDDRIVSIEVRNNELALFIILRNETEGSAAGLEAVNDKVFELLNSYYKDISSRPIVIHESFVSMYNTLPSFKVVHNTVMLTFTSLANKENSLHNIHKVIDTVRLKIIEAATSKKITSSTLGILRIPRLQELYYSSLSEPEWFKIVNKYLETKNILACQIELIENDLEEYAQL